MASKRNLPPEELEARLGYHFEDKAYLEKALRHRSAVKWRSEKQTSRKRRLENVRKSNERLEFVGDRVLGLVVAELLFSFFPDESEGELGARLAHLVSRYTLAEVAQGIDLGHFIQVALQEAKVGVHQGEGVTADAMEAVLGAIFLDGGFVDARRIIRHFWLPIIKANPSPPKEPKTALQEVALRDYKSLPIYETADTKGQAHAPVFVVQVRVGPQIAYGEGSSKRAAQREAAKEILRKMNVSYHKAATS